jgi:AbrB family looped-hinge helix DNA binding protein
MVEQWYDSGMRTTIDRAGRVVIPKPMREELGWRGGEELEISARDGRIEIEQTSPAMTLVERDGFLAAEIEGHEVPGVTADEVREVLERLRR